MTELTQNGAIGGVLAGRPKGPYANDDFVDTPKEKTVSRRTIYVYQAPVRIWHWTNAFAMLTLFVTGYLIASPPESVTGEAYNHFQMGYIRFAHFAAGQVMALAFLLRLLFAFVGNANARELFFVPFWRPSFWRGVIFEARWYAFLERYPKQYIGHNPLAHLMMFFLFTLTTIFMICTGFALYSEGAGRSSWEYKAFGWVFSIFPNSQDVHTFHHLGLWILVSFTIAHIYAAVREDIMSRQSMISSMISGERQFRDDKI